MSSQPPAPPPPPILPKIAGFELIRELGRGAMGVVYLARDERIGRQVAIKTIDIASLQEPSAAKSSHPAHENLERALLEEARTAGNLNHPHIVTIYQVGVEGNLLFVVMEYLGGGTLASRLSPGVPAPTDWALRVLAEVASALDAAHHEKFVHRDIKPSNILLVPTIETAKVADFGLARAFTAQRTQTMVAGTPFFMSPEQVEGKPLDGRSDQFSLGILAYQLFTGHLPFDADNMVSLAFQISTMQPKAANEHNRSLPASAANVIARAMHKSKDKRFDRCSDFVTALETAFREPNAPTAFIPKANRSPASTLLGLSSLAITFIALATVTWLFFVSPDPGPTPPPQQQAQPKTAPAALAQQSEPPPPATTTPASATPATATTATTTPATGPLFFPNPTVPEATVPKAVEPKPTPAKPLEAKLPEPKAAVLPKPTASNKTYDPEATASLLAAVRDGGSPGQLEALLDRGANPDGNDNGNPLYNALQACREDAAQVLLARKADPNRIGPFELPALVAAITADRYGKPCDKRESMTKLLLDKGANPNGVPGHDSPIERAAQLGPEGAPLVRLLLDRGANPQPALERSIGFNGRRADSLPCDTTSFDLLIGRGAKPNAVSPSSSRFPLHTAAEVGCEDVVRTLLSNGASVDQVDADGRSALYFTADRGRNRWAAQIAKVLVAAGANPNLAARPRESASSDRGVTPLMLSVKKNIDFLTTLLDKGGNPNLADAQGRTALHHAIHWSNDKAVALLLSRGANLGARDKNGRTPLGLARSKGLRDSDPSVKLLLAANAPE